MISSRVLIAAGVLAVAAAGTAQPPTDGRFDVPPDGGGVEQAQFVRPVPVGGRPMPAAPAPPNLQLLVLVPQDAAPKGEITYTLRLTNGGGSDAHMVEAWMPAPVGGLLVDADPKPDAAKPEKYVWKWRTMAAGETKTITVKVKPKDDAKELIARAYVRSEHGQQVITKLNVPKLKVKTEAAQQAVFGDAIPVRVTVTNDGKVPVRNAKLTTTVGPGFTYDKDAGGEPTKEPGQRVWDLDTLPPGGGKVVQYRVTAKDLKNLTALSVATGGDTAEDKSDATVVVKEAKLVVNVAGDVVALDKPAFHEISVKNTGGLPLSNVRVTGTIPADCRVVKQTNLGTVTRGQIAWVEPRIDPGHEHTYRYWMMAENPGRHTIRATAAAARGPDDTKTVETVFNGAAVLNWETAFDPSTVGVDKSGMFTVVVKNTGTEASKGVKLVVTLPKEVSLSRATPANKPAERVLTFDPQDVPAGKSMTYSVEFRGEVAGQAFFEAKLADGTTGKPRLAEKYVEITRRR